MFVRDNSFQSTPDRKAAAGRVILEAALVALIGLGVALAANRISPRGLALARNYFPGGTNGLVARPIVVASPGGANGTNQSASVQAAVEGILKEKDLRPIDGEEAERLFRDPRFQQDRIVFVDAREEASYQEGHIPGAHQLHHVYLNNLPTVFTACQSAEQVVVYCNGGLCDESIFTALLLRDQGIPNSILRVYTGGFDEWAANGLPIEIGARKSGNLRNASK